MNTTITITVGQLPGDSTVEIQNVIARAFGEFDRVVGRFTRFNEDSELANLNRNSGEWTVVTAELFMLVETMLDLAKKSNGAFDPTVIDFLETYGYDRNYDFSRLDNPDLDKFVKKVTRERKSWQEIELDKSGPGIKLAKGQRLDLGGIGKGYAIDLAYKHLDKYQNFMIDGGGDFRVKGGAHADPAQGEKYWKLSLKHKNQQTDGLQTVGTVKASNTALACSGSWSRRVKQFHHLINTATGKPVEDLQTVYVQAQAAALADGWATALFVGGKELLQKLPDGMEAMLIGSDNKAVSTAGFHLH
ncbi:FAD:protein FMN transferase [Candidatus Dojkabacteria bacterium]|uniref:FAD:protein FMN transferase n=1 Tax=Candidatus Dojkabacteria bacterium TaxID=2099670 RepID=A0A955KZB0_9BACT|nr:FAD:protein FMN transferase [Candidatus Dojkabacteria bacterium]